MAEHVKRSFYVEKVNKSLIIYKDLINIFLSLKHLS